MKLGILGTGMIVKHLLTTIEKLPTESIYILGTEQTRDETLELQTQYNLDSVYFDYEELLASDVDTIYVALPNHLHFQFSMQALSSGKHVIIEKPITTSVVELEQLISKAKENNLHIFEAMNIPYLPAFKEVKKNISNLGNIKIVSFNYSQYSSRYSSFKEGVILPAFDYKKAGGALMDLNIYNIHTIVNLFGLPQNAVYAPNIENNVDTSGILTMDYGDFKAVAIAAKDCKAPMQSTIQGDAGVIVINSSANTLFSFELIDNNNEVVKYDTENKEHRLYYEFLSFIDNIDNDKLTDTYTKIELSLDIVKLMEKLRRDNNLFYQK